MNRNLVLAGMLAPICGLATAWAGDSQPLPTPFPALRYEQMTARSPFAVASTTAPTPAAAPDFAAQLYVDGVAHLGDADFVAIKSRDVDKPQTLFLEVGKSSEDGMKVDRIRWSDVMGKSTVEVSKGGEKATLEFDEALVAKDDTGPVPNNGAAAGFPFNRGIRLPQMPGMPPPRMLPRDAIRARRAMMYQRDAQ